MELIGYKKGGGGGSTPTEARDSLRSISYARVLDLLSEGEIGGLVDGGRSIILDGTPLQNSDGSYNFQNVKVDTRVGTQDQGYIAGFPAVESEYALGVELKSDQDWSRLVNRPTLSALRLRLTVPQLQQTNTSNGNITGYRIEYAIDLSTDGAAFQNVFRGAFDGKTTTTYTRSHRIDLPKAKTGWQLRVHRITPNKNSATIADRVTIESLTEVIDAKLRYPNSAVVGIQIDASQFSSIPTRAYDCYLRLIRVPDNYDPRTRTYVGIWKGNFKIAWTDNPAWIYYDLVLHQRYGLGDRINATQIDKFQLYRIAQYCDELVPDGKGGTEPRFACNVYLQTQEQAYKVLQDLASIFRGVSYWASGQVVVAADAPADTAYLYTPANIIDGKFTYAGSPLSTRYTTAMVSWCDQSDMGRQKVEYVEDPEGIARYGINKADITAFGCTSQSQAQRAGQWALISSRLETGTVSFSVGLDGAICLPGQIVAIADPHRAGRRNGGRIRAVAGKAITLDKAPVVRAGDLLSVVLPTAVIESREVLSVDGDTVTVKTAFSTPPIPESVWLLDSAELAPQLFRVMNVKMRDKDGLIFDITGTQHEPGKFGAVDYGTRIDVRPITVIPPSVQPPPANVRLTTFSMINQGIALTSLNIAWDAAQGAIAYVVEWRRDNGDWVTAGRTGGLGVDIQGIYAGAYVARVRAINPLEVASVPAYSMETQLQGKTTPPPVVTMLKPTALPMAIRLDWGFPSGPLDVERTEIWYSTSNDRANAIKLADLAYPQNTYTQMGLAAAVDFWYWARLIDKSGNIGAWYPDGQGVHGRSSSDATEILAYLGGQIGETQLAKSMLDKIDSGAGATVKVDQLASDVAAQWSVKVGMTANGQYYFGGLGLGIENNAGVVTSQVLVMASRFAVINDYNNGVTPAFVVQGGQTIINDAVIGRISANKIDAGSLSAITSNLGDITAGVIHNADWSIGMNLNAGPNDYALWAPGFWFKPDGSGYMARGRLGGAVAAASGNSVQGFSIPSGGGSVVFRIDTGVDIDTNSPETVMPYFAVVTTPDPQMAQFQIEASVVLRRNVAGASVYRVCIVVTLTFDKQFYGTGRGFSWVLYRS
ncbi:host specificity protein J [Silvimonas soli]|uniref:host specificity protein J n=1 Tax=Silvimonas soli TaxID=2980100 RepID=UPI0024B37A79|nr:host specificity protein J [Silvimonas soli]